MEEIYRQKEADLLSYTRRPDEERYPEGLARSIHFAWSRDGRSFQALNQNYGILFAEGTIGEDNVIHPKGLRNPWVFQMAAGNYGIMAVRVNQDGSADEESFGKVLYWITEDFMEFNYIGLLDLGSDEEIKTVTCTYDSFEGKYHITWKTRNGKCFQITTEEDIICQTGFSAVQSINGLIEGGAVHGPKGAVAGNVVKIGSGLCDRIIQKWSRIFNTEIIVPDHISVSSFNELSKVTATAVYSDGSTVQKKVLWDLEGPDSKKPGEYTINGTVTDRKYPFPLATGFADPMIFPWEGKYYFIATNDNLNDVGLYVREAEVPDRLFDEGIKQQLILAYDEKRNFIQTFWAPEFHLIGGELYILFAVGGKVWGPQCHLMKLKKGGHIPDAESWEEPKRIQKKDGTWLTTDGISLDMTYLEAGSNGYMIWSYRENIGTKLDSGSMLYIASADKRTPWKLTSDPVLLSRPLFGWENVEGTINNEGPHAFVAGDTVYVTYSGGAADGYTYALGLLTAKAGDDLLQISNWKKSNTPVLTFYSVEGEYGSGHNSFFIDPEGNLMIAYHAEDALTHHLRCSGIRRVHFNMNEKPVFDMSAERDLNPELRRIFTNVMISDC
ncbi:family 43 glycosylhydrolase [Lacrimispora sp. 38-1]|uniref:family 43 glycosylhydrolase n=1 Tax=Lacrimispora sp. 38-1 TaxID=3125778 RepID=UPI003CE6CB08